MLSCDICEFSLQTFRADVARFPYALKENQGKHKKNKNFVVRALKTKQVGNVFSLRGYQENPTFVKYSNGGR